jgi:hypothetical protein
MRLARRFLRTNHSRLRALAEAKIESRRAGFAAERKLSQIISAKHAHCAKHGRIRDAATVVLDSFEVETPD